MHRHFIFAALSAGLLQPPQQPSPSAPGPISPPKLLSSDASSLRACKGVQPAEVKLQFTVNTDGAAKDIKVLATPSQAHTACALAALSAYQYLPAMQDGHPIAVQIALTLNVPPGN